MAENDTPVTNTAAYFTQTLARKKFMTFAPMVKSIKGFSSDKK